MHPSVLEDSMSTYLFIISSAVASLNPSFISLMLILVRLSSGHISLNHSALTARGDGEVGGNGPPAIGPAQVLSSTRILRVLCITYHPPAQIEGFLKELFCDHRQHKVPDHYAKYTVQIRNYSRSSVPHILKVAYDTRTLY